MSSLSRAAYRTRQLGAALRPRVRPAERREAERLLGERLYRLFASMQRADQRHCLDVCTLLRSEDCADEDVLTAALIHDAGKGRLAGARIGVVDRILYTTLESAAPGLLARLARHMRGINDLRRHGERGLRLAREYGAPEGVMRLLEALEDSNATDGRALLLRAADGCC